MSVSLRLAKTVNTAFFSGMLTVLAMAKLTRNNKNSRPSSTDKSSASSRQGNPTLVIGMILAVGVSVLFYVFFSNLQAKETIMVASTNIPAFSNIQPSQLTPTSVPKDSVNETDLTAATYNEKKAKNESIVNRIEILKDQRISSNAIGSSSLGSLSVVKPSEEVVAVSTSLTGAAGGVVVPGSVVNVYSTSGDTNTPLVAQAKVLAVGTGPQVASSVQPNSKVSSGNSSSGGLIVLLAVRAADAGKLLGQSQVALAYNPRKSFNGAGDICDINQCVNKAADSASPGN